MSDDNFFEDDPSTIAQGFGFSSQREFDDYCDEMDRNSRLDEEEGAA